MVIMQHEKMNDERNLTMNSTKVILKDASYLHSKTSITFILKDVVIEEDNKFIISTLVQLSKIKKLNLNLHFLIVTWTI